MFARSKKQTGPYSVRCSGTGEYPWFEVVNEAGEMVARFPDEGGARVRALFLNRAVEAQVAEATLDLVRKWR